MNIVKTRKLTLALSLIGAMILMLALSSVALASPAQSGGGTTGKICVDGYVINHREVPVDGTRVTPPLVVEAVDRSGAMISANVGADGYFKLEKLAEGEWNFGMQLPPEWDGIVPAAARGGRAETGFTALKNQDNCYRIVFKIRRWFDVTVIKWEELLDGSVRPGAEWEITFLPQGDPFVKKQTQKTNASGGAVFSVTPGTWVIQETVKPGWVPVTPPKVTLVLDQYLTPDNLPLDPVIFKNRQPPCTGKIKVSKTGWGRDAQGNLVWLGPLAGWQVTLTRSDGMMAPMTKVTDASGTLVFDSLHPGVYKVQEHVQLGWKAVTDNPQTIIIRDCETQEVKFENEETKGRLNISGKKLYKAWSGPTTGLGLSGWVITATLVGTDIMTTTTTNALGEYMFSEATLQAAGMGFPGATIQVCEADRTNWIHITPKCVTITFPYPVPEDYPGAVVNFTNIQDPPLPGTVPAAGSCSAYYKVQPGETLSSIAARNGTSVSALTQANGIKNANYIRAGQTLCVP